VLLIVVGGTHAVAVFLQLKHHVLGLAAGAVAGFGMLVWIFVEMAMLPFYSPLQAAYFATGAIQLAIILVLLGVAPWIVKAPRATS